MKFKLYNATTKRWVQDTDSDEPKDCEYDNLERAQTAMRAVNQLKRLNPEHKNDRIVLSVDGECPFCGYPMVECKGQCGGARGQAQPQRSEPDFTIGGCIYQKPKQPPATDAWQKIHKGIQSNLEAARKTPEYEEEGRELETDSTAAQDWTENVKIGPALRHEVNSLMESAQDDLESVLFQLVGQREHAQQQLAAERGNRDGFRRALEQRIGEVDKLRQQLLAAEVAIAEHNKTVATFKPPMQGITADLSALETHVAKAVKPLVELLERWMNWMGEESDRLVDDTVHALAKVGKKVGPE